MEGVSIAFYVLDDEWSGLHDGLELRKISRGYLDAISFVPRQHFAEAQAAFRSKTGREEMTKADYQELRQQRMTHMPSTAMLEMRLRLEELDADR